MTEEVAGSERRGGRCLPRRLADLRQKLGQKAKQEKRYRFYSLYGHICRPETLRAAWERVRDNGGSAGVDGVSIE